MSLYIVFPSEITGRTIIQYHTQDFDIDTAQIQSVFFTTRVPYVLFFSLFIYLFIF